MLCLLGLEHPGRADLQRLTPDALCPERNPVLIYDRHGSPDPARWEVVRTRDHAFASVRDVVLENDLARATYEPVSDAMPASHTLYFWTGNAWGRITGEAYGDYMYWLNGFAKPAVSVELTVLGPNLSEARFRYEHRVDIYIYHFDVVLLKSVAVNRCAPGMFVRFESDPKNPTGEREFGVGEPRPLSFSKAVLALHPIARQHVNLAIGSTAAPYWGVTLSPWKPTSIIVLNRPIEISSYEFHPSEYGWLTVHFVDEQDVVPERYQAFLGGSTFDGSHAIVELEDAADSVIEVSADANASGGQLLELPADTEVTLPFITPTSGTYSIWLRYCSDAASGVQLTIDGVPQAVELPATPALVNHLAIPIIALEAGDHGVAVQSDRAVGLDAMVVLPLDGDDSFPEAIARSVHTTLRGP